MATSLSYKRLFALVALLVLMLAACRNRGRDGDGGGGAGAGGVDGGGGTGGAEPTAAQEAAVAAGVTAYTVAHDLLLLSDLLFNFDPDLDPNESDSNNRDTIQSNAEALGCGTVTGNGLTGLTVDFGAGCTFGDITVAGAVTIDVSVTGPDGARTVHVDLDFAAFVINGFDVDGSLAFATSDGPTLDVVFDLSHAGTSYTGSATVAGAPGTFAADGSLEIDDGASTTSLDIVGLTVAQGACWPQAGTLTVSSSTIQPVSLAFDAGTPTTGQATATFTTAFGQFSTCYALASHGSCVATPCASGAG
jgi:hypothetical protein